MRTRVAGVLLVVVLAMTAQCVVLCSGGIGAAPTETTHCGHHRPGKPAQPDRGCAYRQPFLVNPVPFLAILQPAPEIVDTALVQFAAADPTDTGPPPTSPPSSKTVLRV